MDESSLAQLHMVSVLQERLAALAAAPPGSITAVQGAARSQSSPEVELQQAARQAAAESTGAAAAPPARSVSLDVATLASPQPAQHAAVAPVSSTAISSNGPVEAAAMPMASSNSTTGPALGANAAAVSRDAAGVNCGNPLKGLLSCAAPACIAHTAADTPLDPEA